MYSYRLTKVIDDHFAYRPVSVVRGVRLMTHWGLKEAKGVMDQFYSDNREDKDVTSAVVICDCQIPSDAVALFTEAGVLVEVADVRNNLVSRLHELAREIETELLDFNASTDLHEFAIKLQERR